MLRGGDAAGALLRSSCCYVLPLSLPPPAASALTSRANQGKGATEQVGCSSSCRRPQVARTQVQQQHASSSRSIVSAAFSSIARSRAAFADTTVRTLAKAPSTLLVPMAGAPAAAARAAAAAGTPTAAVQAFAAGGDSPGGGGGGACMVCVPLTADSVEGMVQDMREAASAGADIVEIRVDHLRAASVEQLREALEVLLPPRADQLRLPVVVTCRASWEGGKYEGDEEGRLGLLQYAMRLGAEYVDVELKAAPEFMERYVKPLRTVEGPPDALATKVIVSSHDFSGMPGGRLGGQDAVLDLVGAIAGTGADVAKVACTAMDICDNAAVFGALLAAQAEHQIPIIALLMGERGLLSRLLAPKYGALLTFAALSPQRASAPGQPTVADLLSLYRVRSVTHGTRVLGVIGNPVGHSRSPVLHNAALARAGVSDCVYVPLLVDDLRSFLAAFASADYAGFSVTIPHKLAALECCDEVEPLAERIGAVNTLIRQPDGRLVGFNTDCEAAISAIEDGLRESSPPSSSSSTVSPLAGRVVVVVGAGGAGRALAFGAKDRGAYVVIANRNVERAAELAAAVGGVAMPLSVLQDTGEEDSALLQRYLSLQQPSGESQAQTLRPVLANSTSVGMHPATDETPVAAPLLPHFAVVFDAVYTPLRTRLLAEAEAAGAVTVSGLEMFVRQAARQFELFTGKDAPVDLMREVVLKSL